jgi:hypothetical protein
MFILSALFFFLSIYIFADPDGCVVYGVGLWLLTSWDCGFESRRGHECPS